MSPAVRVSSSRRWPVRRVKWSAAISRPRCSKRRASVAIERDSQTCSSCRAGRKRCRSRKHRSTSSCHARRCTTFRIQPRHFARWLASSSRAGRIITVDVQSAEVPEEAALHNALEILRDPSHVRMLPKSELHRSLADAGLEIEEAITWTNHREFSEWMKITAAPERIAPLECRDDRTGTERRERGDRAAPGGRQAALRAYGGADSRGKALTPAYGARR